jgi:hypothetical protein
MSAMNVYILLADFAGKRCIKVGKAAEPRQRLESLQVGSPVLLELICVIPCKNNRNALALESHAHNLLSRHAMHGEWFRLPETEWLDVSIALFRRASELDKGNPKGDLPEVEADLISLAAWAARLNPKPAAKTYQRWVRVGNISPRPQKIGRSWYVTPNAVFVGRGERVVS